MITLDHCGNLRIFYKGIVWICKHACFYKYFKFWSK